MDYIKLMTAIVAVINCLINIIGLVLRILENTKK